MKHALSVDVEEWFQVEALKPFVGRERWSTLASRLEVGLERTLDLLDRYGTRATFFVLGWVAERHPALIGEVARRGHEVACHGYDHEMVTRQTPGTFREDVRRARAILEDVTGAPIEGYRAPTWSIRAENVWALEVLRDLGFRYDSSFRSVKAAARAGLPASGSFFPVGLNHGGPDIFEFPSSSVAGLGLSLPMAGGGFLRLFPYWFTAAFLRAAERAGRPGNIYVHPWELDPDHPRLARGAVASFRTYIGLGSLAAKLERLLGEFRFAPMREVLGLGRSVRDERASAERAGVPLEGMLP